MSQFLSSNELFINIKDAPKWNPKKNYFDQSIDVLDFYLEERRKLTEGVTIGGYFIHPWLYWHINFFKTPIPTKDKQEKIMNPPLDDNILYMIENYQEAEQTNKGLCMFGTRGFSKALRDDEKLLYEDNSWRNIGDAKTGDKIFGADGKLTNILGVYPQGEVDLYKVTLLDGREVVCCDEHLWQVYDFQARRVRTLPLKELLNSYKYIRNYTGNKYKNGIPRKAEVYNYYIPQSECMEFSEKHLDLEPYYLGLWIGDGTSASTAITTVDEEIHSYIKKIADTHNLTITTQQEITHHISSGEGVGLPRGRNPILNKLKEYNLINNKHIPKVYLESSKEQRFELLRGLLDSDGTISKAGQISFTQSNENLILQVRELVLSLGLSCKLDKIVTNYVLKNGELAESWVLIIYTGEDIFKLTRKRDRIVGDRKNNKFNRTHTSIVNIEKVKSGKATCIRVDNEDKLFVTTNYVVTHNSTMISSLTTWLNTSKPNGTTSIIGGDKGDLAAISKLLGVGFNNVNPALFIPQLITDWEKEVEFGLREKDGFRLPHSHVSITNAEKGTGKSSEKGAGLSPVGFIMDEALHEDSLIPTPNGLVAMKYLNVGDFVLNEDGEPTEIESKINPGVVDTYEFIFSDGSKVVSSENHRWKVRVNGEGWDVWTTAELIGKWMCNTPPHFPKLNSEDVFLESFIGVGKSQVYCIGVKDRRHTFLTEHGIVTHNCGKYDFKAILTGALPSFTTQYGAKLVHILSGTSGNTELTKDAKEVLSDPAAFNLIMMNWDRLDKSVPEEAITWGRSKKEKFSVFVPAQMSYRLEVPKIKTNLADHLKINNESLKLVDINVTNWVEASKHIQDKNASFKKEADREKNRMYYPLEIADVFITSASNPFPTAVIDKHIRELEDAGTIGKDVNLYKSGSETKSEFSNKKRAAVSHGGGEADAPVILFGELPSTPPPKYTFVSGLDDYKLDLSDTDSVGAFFVLKRRNLSPDTPCETIAASYSGRPFRHAEFHNTCETMLDAWSAVCCMEAVDVSFKQHLDAKRKSEQCLAPGISFSQTSQNNGGYSGNTKFGIYPTGGNKTYMFNLLVDAMKEEYVIGIDDLGNEIVKYGVEYIDDIDLLKEMLSYKKGGNYDRITAFMHALTYARELDKNSVRPKEEKKQNFSAQQSSVKTKISIYGNKRPNAF